MIEADGIATIDGAFQLYLDGLADLHFVFAGNCTFFFEVSAEGEAPAGIGDGRRARHAFAGGYYHDLRTIDGLAVERHEAGGGDSFGEVAAGGVAAEER